MTSRHYNESRSCDLASPMMIATPWSHDTMTNCEAMTSQALWRIVIQRHRVSNDKSRHQDVASPTTNCYTMTSRHHDEQWCHDLVTFITDRDTMTDCNHDLVSPIVNRNCDTMMDCNTKIQRSHDELRHHSSGGAPYASRPLTSGSHICLATIHLIDPIMPREHSHCGTSYVCGLRWPARSWYHEFQVTCEYWCREV